MKSLRLSIVAISTTILFAGCDVFNEIVRTLPSAIPTTTTTSTGLTELEVISGLKDALTVGTDTATKILSMTDGFYKNEILKILLPPEADIIMKNKDNEALKALGITRMINDVILKMNRSAEAAVTKAGPIFKDAILNMSFTDAMGILKGGDTAATSYFRTNTTDKLVAAFKPVVNSYLDQDLVGSTSTNEAWEKLTAAYNKVAALSTSLTPVNVKLGDYVTSRAIHGLFTKVAEEEMSIRKDPVARVTEILKKVFGYQG